MPTGWPKGKPRHKMTDEHKRKIAATKMGAKSHFWRGGLTPIHRHLRQTLEYRLWREAVFKRDKWTCLWCNKKGGWSKAEKRQITLNADHIKPFALFPELRLALDNGRTLCEDCHRTTSTFGKLTLKSYKESLH